MDIVNTRGLRRWRDAYRVAIGFVSFCFDLIESREGRMTESRSLKIRIPLRISQAANIYLPKEG